MSKVKCDICGGAIEIASGGKGKCINCGITYTVEAIREKFSNGNNNSNLHNSDYKNILEMYLKQYDWSAAGALCQNILKQDPMDEYAQTTYLKLKELENYEIKDNILIKYHGRSRRVEIPEGVIGIAAKAFEDCRVFNEFIIPGSIKKAGGCFMGGWHIHNVRVLNKIVFKEGVEEIVRYCYKCYEGEKLEIVLPKSLKKIDACSFYLEQDDRYYPYNKIKLSFPNGKSDEIKSFFWQRAGRCKYCGGEVEKKIFKGCFCKECGKQN